MKKTLLFTSILFLFLACSNERSSGKKNNKASSDDFPSDVVMTKTEDSLVTHFVEKPIINVYLENSGSMDGYVNGGTDFASILYRYLTGIQSANIAEAIQLFYINSNLIPLGNDITQFDNKHLTPRSFRDKGGKRGETDISDLFSRVLERTDDNKVSVLISDFIFSPGNKVSASQYLEDQKTAIMSSFSEHLQNKDLALIFYQFTSNFNGYYYNLVDARTKINASRPFYICLMGEKACIQKLFNTKIMNDALLTRHLSNSLSLMKRTPIDYAVVPGSGKFKLVKNNPKKAIQKAKLKKGMLTCVVNLDLSDFPIAEEYITNVENYTLSDPDFELRNIKKTNIANYSHQLRWEIRKIKPSSLKIHLLQHVPQWVDDYSDRDGVDINAGDAMRQTYGLNYLIEGINAAYTKENDGKFTTIEINVNKD